LRELSRLSALVSSDNVYELAEAPTALETDVTVNPREQSVILASANVEPGLEGCTPLANQDRSGRDELAVVTLDSETLGLAIPAVLGTS